MEEPMSSSVEDAIEEPIEMAEPADTPSASCEMSGAEPQAVDGQVADLSGPAVDPALSDQRALKGILEALLFVTAEPIPVTRFQALLGAVTKQDVDDALAGLAQDYEQEGRGLQLAEVAGGYRLVTKAEFAPWLKRLEKVKAPSKLSRSAVESLAIIAYKQPIVRAEVEQIRGVETSGVIRTLLERKLVRIVGRKEEPGRPIMYGTTKFFLEHFGLRDLSQLPPLREFKELGESEQAMLPIEDMVVVDGASVPQDTASSDEGFREDRAEPVALPESGDDAAQAPEGVVVEAENGSEGELVVAELLDES